MTAIREIFNKESEDSVIGGMMIPNCDPKLKHEAFDLLHEEMFYLEVNRKIFAAQKELIRAGQPVDMTTVVDYMENNGDSDIFTFIAEKVKNTPSSANLIGYVQNVRKAFYKRQLISTCQESIDLVYSGEDPENTLNELETKLVEVSKLNGADHIEHVNDISDAWIAEMERRMAAGGEITGQATGITDLDNSLLGLNEDDLIVIAGKPGTGKTLIAQHINRYVAVNENKPCLFFSMEMSRVQVYERFVSGEAGVPPSEYRKGLMSDNDWKMTQAASLRIKNSGIHIVSKPALSVGQIRAMARKFKAQNPEMGLIVIDYLSKMSLPKADRHDIAIGKVTTALKEMAQELKCPVILLSQMNRGSDRLQGKRPQMADLKDSSSIEQDADVIIMLHREGRLNENYPQNILEIIIRKSRHVDAEKTIYLRCVSGGYQYLPEHEAMSEIETMSENVTKQFKRAENKGGGF